jgi:ABC-2 type transport system ATP-binding protein
MIEIKNLLKTFGPIKAVDNVSFKVNEGEVLGFLGPNGAGKTTTMKLITGFYEPTGGTITVGGLDVVKNSLATRRQIGYLPETVPLYNDMKVYEYLKFVAEIRDVAPSAFLQRLREVVEKCGLRQVVGKNIDELSKGYRQRVGLAQAIMHDPEILILDEPTTGLDPNQISEIRELIKAIGRAKTVLFSTHILAEAQATCDRVVIINKGEIVGEGKPAELMAEFNGRAEFYLKLPAPADEVLACLRGLSSVAEAKKVDEETSDISGYRLLAASRQARQDVARALLDRGWPILEFRPLQASLEEVFKELTK